MFTETSKHAMLPVRDQLNENGKGNIYEPNYETNTFGLKSSYRTKEVNSILKAKHRYILFANKYEGIDMTRFSHIRMLVLFAAASLLAGCAIPDGARTGLRELSETPQV